MSYAPRTMLRVVLFFFDEIAQKLAVLFEAEPCAMYSAVEDREHPTAQLQQTWGACRC